MVIGLGLVAFFLVAASAQGEKARESKAEANAFAGDVFGGLVVDEALVGAEAALRRAADYESQQKRSYWGAGAGVVVFIVGVGLFKPSFLRRDVGERMLMYYLASGNPAEVSWLPADAPKPTDAIAATPAGWHDDPTTPGQYRYWDGTAWTEHVAPK
jgi:hypothetical protein